MNTLAAEFDPLAVNVVVTDDLLKVMLTDGHEVAAPLAWFPGLRDATRAELENWRLIGGGIGIHWEAVDEDISIATLLLRGEQGITPAMLA